MIIKGPEDTRQPQELDFYELQKEWVVIAQQLQATADQIRKDHLLICGEYEEINRARLRVIADQKRALRAYKLASFRSWMRKTFRPRIGVLYQHEPRRFLVPARYSDHAVLAKYPTISIVTPSFNQGEFLERTVLSVLDQRYAALEYIIQDGGSKDDTVDVIKRHQASIKRWESCPDQGQSDAINRGFRYATGEIMAYLNSDDILLPGTLNYVADYFNKHPDVDVVYGHRILINADDQEVGRWILPPHDSEVLTWADYVPQETLFWRRRIWDKVGGNIDESFKFAMDWDLLLRFKEAGAKFVRLPRFLGAFRVHQAQKTSANISDTGVKEMVRLRQRCHGRKVTYSEIKQHIGFYLLRHIVLHKLYRMRLLTY